MILQIEDMTCAACKETFEGASPFNVFQCRRCRKELTLCDACRARTCPRCGGQLRNLDERLAEENGGGHICW